MNKEITFNLQTPKTTEWFDIGDPVIRVNDESDPPTIWLVKAIDDNMLIITNQLEERGLYPHNVIKLV